MHAQSSPSSQIDVEHDELTPVSAMVRARLGKRVSPATLWRWRLRGVRAGGQTIKLECVRVAGVWHTTPAAWAAFITAQTAAATAAEPPSRRPANARRRRSAACAPPGSSTDESP